MIFYLTTAVISKHYYNTKNQKKQPHSKKFPNSKKSKSYYSHIYKEIIPFYYIFTNSNNDSY